MNKNKVLMIPILIFLFNNYGYGQCEGWNWPKEEAIAKEKTALYTDALKSSDFAMAVKPHRWLLQNAPNLSSSLYINGVKIFSGLADLEKNELKKKEWIDSLMLMYDMRIQYCGGKEDIMDRKAFDAYKYKINDKGNLPELLQLYDEVFKIRGHKMDYFIILPYMHIISQNARLLKNLTPDQILERYEKLMDILDHKIKEGGAGKSKLEEIKPNIEDIFIQIYPIDCDFVRKNLGPKFKANPDDLNNTRKIFSFMLAGKCTDDPLWLEAAKKIQEAEPEYGLAKNIGAKCLAKKDYECANKYLDEALSLTQDPANKAEIYMSLGKMKEDQGSLLTAREMYHKVLEVDPTRKDAYKNIGLLYFNSFSSCRAEKDPIKDRAVFLAAYDMFKKAGEPQLMQNAKEQFPLKSEIFERLYTKGENINTGCWMNVDTVIRARDE